MTYVKTNGDMEMRTTKERNKDVVVCEDVIHFYCSVNRDERAACGKITGRQFLIKKGSRVQLLNGKNSLKRDSRALRLRKKLEDDNIIVDGFFTCDYTFDSPSIALKVIRATSQGNLNEWADREGHTIKGMWQSILVRKK